MKFLAQTRLVMPVLVSFLTLTLACGQASPEASDTSALTNKTTACTNYPAATIAQLEAEVKAVPNLFQNFSQADQADLLKHLQAVPPAYRAQLFALKKSGSFRGIVKRDLGSGGVMGQCSYGSNGPREIAITSRHNNAISFAFIHEVGHGLEPLIQRKAGKNSREWDTIVRGLMQEANAYNQGGGASRANQVRDYALTSDAEFFAESFHNFYCSPETNSFIQKNLPKTYAFLLSVLEKPVFSTGGNEKPTEPVVIPDDPKTEDAFVRANRHALSVLSAFNKISSTCDLRLRSVSGAGTEGDFRLDVSAVNAKNQALPTIRFVTNFNNGMDSELADLKKLVPRLFQGCTAE